VNIISSGGENAINFIIANVEIESRRRQQLSAFLQTVMSLRDHRPWPTTPSLVTDPPLMNGRIWRDFSPLEIFLRPPVYAANHCDLYSG